MIIRERGKRKGVNVEIVMGQSADYLKGLLWREQNRIKVENRRIFQGGGRERNSKRKSG